MTISRRTVIKVGRIWIAIGLASGALALANGAEPPVRSVPGTPLEQHEIVDSLGRTVTYYISHPKKTPAPILLMIQGSGCDRVMNEKPSGSFSTLYNLVPYAQEGQFTVVAVEKPFSGMPSGMSGGTAQSCSPEFNADFTAERWLVALRAALNDARKAPQVDVQRTLVFGFSEGAVMADMLSGHDDTVTDVIAIAGSGTTQLFDFVALAYRTCFDASVCLAEIERNVQAINANPNSSTEFAWGHPYKRWSSFFRVDPSDELVRSKARVYIAFGTADESVPALSEELAIAKLRLAGRAVTVRRVPNAGHSLSDSQRTNYRDMDNEFRAALNWFWQEGH
jgi:pimeloyl-ACP methyl ester carboxylesterase